MKTGEHDDLWDLLGKAKTPEVSPFFSRDILRAIREETRDQPGIFAWLLRRWQIAVVAGCAVISGGFALLPEPEAAPDPVVMLAQQFSLSPDYEVVGHLDELLAYEQDSVWLPN